MSYLPTDLAAYAEIFIFFFIAYAYLQELGMPVENVRGRARLRTASNGSVHLPRVQTTVGRRSFSFYGPHYRTVCHLACVTIDFTEHVRAAAEYFSFRKVMMDNIRCRLDASAVLVPSTLLLTYCVRLEGDLDQIHRCVIPQEPRHNGRFVARSVQFALIIWV